MGSGTGETEEDDMSLLEDVALLDDFGGVVGVNSSVCSGSGSDADCDDDDDDDGEEEVEFVAVEDCEFWALRIKSSIGSGDIRIQVRPEYSVGKVKETVLTALGEPVTRYLRLICKGRMLAPDLVPLNSLKFVQPNDVLHAVFTSTTTTTTTTTTTPASSSASTTTTTTTSRTSVQAALQQGTFTGLSRRALRSAGINASGLAVRRTAEEQEEEDDEEEQENEQQQAHNNNNNNNNNATNHHRGFDRLRVLGLRRAEIAALRIYFSRQVDRFVDQQQQQQQQQQQLAAIDEPDPLLRRQLQEEAWMQSQGPLSEFRLNLPTAGGMALMTLLRNNNNNNNNNNNTMTEPNLMAETVLWQTAPYNNNNNNNNNNYNRTSTTATTATPASNFGNDRDFWCGFLLGFFVGFIMLVWVWMPSIPHRQKLGILTGITVQLALGMLRPTPPDDGHNNYGNNDQHPELARLGLQHSGYAHLLRGSARTATTNTNSALHDRSTSTTDDGIVLG